MKKKYFVILGYIMVLWGAAWFVFGDSGLIETSFKQKEILRLRAEIERSDLEIDEMQRQYAHLSRLSTPDQNFLAGVDRKLQDIVVYKFAPSPLTRLSKDEEKAVILQSLLLGGAFVLIGILSITALTVIVKPFPKEQ